MKATDRYTKTQITLHWLTALAVLVAWFTKDAMGDFARAAWNAGVAPSPTPHTIAGALVVVMVLARLIIRARSGAPEPLGHEHAKLAAIWGHRVLYGLAVLVPALGAATWFGGFRDMSGFHELTAKALMIAALGHAAMAIFHQFVKKDGTLLRMIHPK